MASPKFYPFGGQTYYLGSSCGSTDTSLLLSSFTEPVTGIPYTMALLNTDIVFATISPKSSQSEFIAFTDITQNADGSALLTGVVRGLAKKYPLTEDAAYKLPHSGQSIFIISNPPQLYQEFVSVVNDQTIQGIKTFSSSPVVPDPSNPQDAASKNYVDTIVTAGGVDASSTIKGISKLTVDPVSPTDPIAVGDNDTRVPTQGENDALVGTSGTPSSTNKYVTNNDTSTTATTGGIPRATGGKIDSGWIDTGVTSSKIVQLNGSAQLPAVDGSLLTNVLHNLTTSVNTISANVTNGSTKVFAHGQSGTPKILRITAYSSPSSGSIPVTSTGTYDGSTNRAVYFTGNTLSVGTTSSYVIYVDAAVGTNFAHCVATMDGTNVTLTITNNSGSNPLVNFIWETLI